MKHSLLLAATVLSLNVITATAANQIPKKMVLVEKWSGTWCGPCTGAARALHQFEQENLKTAQISYQIEKTDRAKGLFEIEEGAARGTYYGGVKGYPTTRYNGTGLYENGNATGTIYPAILPIYQKAAAEMTSFDMEVSSLTLSGLDFKAEVNVSKVAPYDGNNIKMRAIVVEKNIAYQWNGMDELHYVARLMPGGADGQPIPAGDSSELSLSGTLSEKWNADELEIIVFLQDDDTKEVLQTVTHPISRTIVQKKGESTSGFDEVSIFWHHASPFADNLKGYNVYDTDNNLMGTVTPESNTFTAKVEKPGTFSIRVAADYAGGEAEKSETMTGKAYRRNVAMSPRGLIYDNSAFSWQQPLPSAAGFAFDSSHQPLEGENGSFTNISAHGGPIMFDIWVVYRLSAEATADMRGLDIARVSFIPGDPNAGYQAGVFVDGNLAVAEDIAAAGLKKGEWHTHVFQNPVFIGGGETIDVGYKITTLKNNPLITDNGPVISKGITNLIGVPDSEGTYTWKTLYEGNNIIKMELGIPEKQGEYPAEYTLQGYDIYRNGEKINDALIPSNEFSFPDAEKTGGTFFVKAVYDNAESIPGNAVEIKGSGLDYTYGEGAGIHVNGQTVNAENASIKVYDMQGRLAAYGEGAAFIPSKGIFIVTAVDSCGKARTAKTIIR